MDSLVPNNNNGNGKSYNEYSSANLCDEYLLDSSCPDPSLSLTDLNQSFLNFSLLDDTVEESDKSLQVANQDDKSLLYSIISQPVLTQQAHGVNANSTKMFNKEYNNDSNITDGASTNSNKKPGIILLGRGNSFSLGRSEVMLLHGSRTNRTSVRRNDNSNYLSAIEDSDNIQNNNKTQNNGNSSPTQVDNKEVPAVAYTNAQSIPTRTLLPCDLEALWQKAELVMAAKETVVQQVLEEFGIGDAGSSDNEKEEKVMEETIWQAVQDCFHV